MNSVDSSKLGQFPITAEAGPARQSPIFFTNPPTTMKVAFIPARIAAVLVLTTISTFAIAAEGDANPHSIVGAWTGDAVNGCSEKYSFSAEGEIRVNSKDEVLVGTYLTEPMPESPKILKLTRTITSSNGAPDCGGKIGNEVGKTRSAYAIWESETELRLCFDTLGYRCFGRFKKQ